jgi:hypothetical protein
MRPLYAIVAAALVAASFGGGYWLRSAQSTVNQELEDQALGGVLEQVAYVHYLEKGDSTGMRAIIDVNLNSYLSKLRAHGGAINDAQFDAARTRVLNAAALIWEAQPPFQSPEWRENAQNSSWWKKWTDEHQQNLALLHAAKLDCAATASLGCKTQPPASTLSGKSK